MMDFSQDLIAALLQQSIGSTEPLQLLPVAGLQENIVHSRTVRLRISAQDKNQDGSGRAVDGSGSAVDGSGGAVDGSGSAVDDSGGVDGSHAKKNKPPHKTIPEFMIAKQVHVKQLGMEKKEEWKLVRDVFSYIVETNFYKYVAPTLPAEVRVPETFAVMQKMPDIKDDVERSKHCEFLTLMEDLSPSWRSGHIVLEDELVCCGLDYLAAMHAHFWGRTDEPLPLPPTPPSTSSSSGTRQDEKHTVASLMWPRGSYWTRDKRPANEPELLIGRWEALRALWIQEGHTEFEDDVFRSFGEEVYSHLELAERVLCNAEKSGGNEGGWGGRGVHGGNNLTLIHGDFKASNVMFRRRVKNNDKCKNWSGGDMCIIPTATTEGTATTTTTTTNVNNNCNNSNRHRHNGNGGEEESEGGGGEGGGEGEGEEDEDEQGSKRARKVYDNSSPSFSSLSSSSSSSSSKFECEKCNINPSSSSSSSPSSSSSSSSHPSEPPLVSGLIISTENIEQGYETDTEGEFRSTSSPPDQLGNNHNNHNHRHQEAGGKKRERETNIDHTEKNRERQQKKEEDDCNGDGHSSPSVNGVGAGRGGGGAWKKWEAVGIDFQWSGVGLGIHDVMYFITSTCIHRLHDDSLARLIGFYCDRLRARQIYYPPPLAVLHFHAAVLNIARVVVPYFWKNLGPTQTRTAWQDAGDIAYCANTECFKAFIRFITHHSIPALRGHANSS